MYVTTESKTSYKFAFDHSVPLTAVDGKKKLFSVSAVTLHIIKTEDVSDVYMNIHGTPFCADGIKLNVSRRESPNCYGFFLEKDLATLKTAINKRLSTCLTDLNAYNASSVLNSVDISLHKLTPVIA